MRRMVNNFYTLKALVREWSPDLEGSTLVDAFSQEADELTLAFRGAGEAAMLRLSVRSPLLFIFRTEGISKKRRNVATLFQEATGRRVASLRIARRDRVLYIDLEGELHLQVLLFGSRANVFLINSEDAVADAFRQRDRHVGSEAPEPRTAPEPATFSEFEARWRTDRNRLGQVVSAIYPIFDRTISEEVVHRSNVSSSTPAACSEADQQALFEAAQSVIEDLQHPAPRVFWGERFAETFSLIPLTKRDGENSEPFGTVGSAVRVFVRSRLAARHFHRLYEPLEESLAEARDHYRRSAERMTTELLEGSRADRYEHWGHLLMAASPDDVPTGAEEVTLPDLFADGSPVTIPVDPARSPVENAERYYDKAREVRTARERAEKRLDETEAQAEEAGRLLEELQSIKTLSELKTFRKKNDEALATFIGEKDEELERFPFRRFPLQSGYEVWVGRNARQNDELTFHRAQKYDLWMHARGVPGAHTILHLPNRDAEPDKRLLHQAAAIAAYYSKARGSGAVPVMMARRKHVRKPSGAPPGAVRVEHEDVIFVEPHRPT